MGEKIELELLWTEDSACPDGKGAFPEVLFLRASRPVIDEHKEEIRALVKAEIEKVMVNCPAVETADDCDYEVCISKSNPLIVCIRIFCPLRIASAAFAAEVMMEALLAELLEEMSVSEVDMPGLDRLPIRVD